MNNQQLYNHILAKVRAISSENFVTFDSVEYIAVLKDSINGNTEYRAKTLAELKEIVDKELKHD
ncbi:hypothetical protein [Francisella philomiragia]|uniref:hypothetical protein n=1 Tax=Francisella philomiragia TaxID=28110 RepID=UPI001C9DA382|nr:hypothetical protein [Francisella philomiragia]MBY7733469.1 hypothetical protein [Francisella philomiragia]